jgi:sulfotransferase family protein
MQRYLSFTRSLLRRQFSLRYAKLWRLRSWFKYFTTSYRKLAADHLSANQENMFFILGAGRSGTQLISDLLNSSTETLVCHEPNFNDDVGLMEELRADDTKMLDYWKYYRSYEIYSRWEASKKKVYGEVNGTIRYHADVISYLYPNATLLLLARDPRGTIRSVMQWPYYQKDSKGAYNLQPLPGDPWDKEWGQMDRFAKVCWSVFDTYSRLLRVIPESGRLKLEDIVSNYDMVKERLLDVLDIDINEGEWKEIVGRPSRNKSKSYQFPHYSEWDNNRKHTYKKICGSVARELGYEEEW